MKKNIFVILTVVLAVGAVFILFKPSINKKTTGDGCLASAGFSYDSDVGACIRSFELTEDIKRAAKLAVSKIGKSYGLTLVSFNSYEEPGLYDLTFEKGPDRTKEKIYIKNWQVIKQETVQTVR